MTETVLNFYTFKSPIISSEFYNKTFLSFKNHMHDDYQQRLIWDPALYETTLEEMAKNNE